MWEHPSVSDIPGTVFVCTEGKFRRKTLLTVINSCGCFKSAKAGFLFFLICLTSQRSEQPADLWQSRRPAKHIPMIRKAKHSRNTWFCMFHSYSWSSHFIKSRCSPERVVLNYISQHPLGCCHDKSTSFVGKKIHVAKHVTTGSRCCLKVEVTHSQLPMSNSENALVRGFVSL